MEELLQPSTSKYTAQLLLKKREFNRPSSTESSTITASETEEQIIGCFKDSQKDTSSLTVSEFKGKLSLLSLQEKR